MKIGIIIPARYGSTRFPGKPLAKIAEKSMLHHVVDKARAVAKNRDNVDILVATEDQRIADHCEEIGVTCIMTSEDCPTGSDRVLEAAQNSGTDYDVLMSLQGDAPFTPAAAIEGLIKVFEDKPDTDVATPVVHLRWTDLDQLRENKKTTPFSGTTAILTEDKRAIWFSKNILPAIRKEDQRRKEMDRSPVYRHIGLYAYRREVLEQYVELPQSHYEKLEGLEQLRILENGFTIQAVPVELDFGQALSGIDTPADLKRAEAVLAAQATG